MAEYYVMHPNLDYSAIVDAPTTEKARTTFLDHLERTGRIRRRYRQQFRADMVAERLENAEGANADVRLSYYYGGREPEESIGFSEMSYEPSSEYEPGPYYEPEPVMSRSPISEVSLGGAEYDREE